MFHVQFQEVSIHGTTSIYCKDFYDLKEAFDYMAQALEEGETDFVAISTDWAKLPAFSKSIKRIKDSI